MKSSVEEKLGFKKELLKKKLFNNIRKDNILLNYWYLIKVISKYYNLVKIICQSLSLLDSIVLIIKKIMKNCYLKLVNYFNKENKDMIFIKNS